VVRHVGNNLIGVLRSLFGTTYDHYPLLASSTWPALVRMEALAFSVGSLVCIAAVAARRELREKALQRYRHVLFVFLALAIFPIGGGTLIYPSVHYLIVPALCLFLIGVLAISLLLPHVRGGSLGWRGLIVVLTLAAIPTPFVLPTEYFDPGKAPVGSLGLTRNVTDAVELIRSLELAEPVHVLTFTDGIGELLGAGFHEVKIWRRGERPLKEYLADEHIDVIVTMEPGQRSFLVDDPYWETIQIEPAAAGFAPVTTPSGAAVARIWVRADLRKESVGTGDATAR
jgi:hypothetical protein